MSASRDLLVRADHPLIGIIRGFAEARTRMTEREVHRDDERPEGEGWTRIENDPVLRIATWERSRCVRAAS